MKSLFAIALLGMTSAVFQASAADDASARMRAGPNASTEGGTTLGQTGIRSNAGDSARPETNAPVKPKPRAEPTKPRAEPPQPSAEPMKDTAPSGSVRRPE